jgi:hypothetical protein
MDPEKTYKNKDLIVSEAEFEKSITNDFIGEDFTDKLEWAMLMIQSNFKQIRFADYLPMVTKSHFDKSYLLTDGLLEGQKFLKPLTDFQATPEMFPMLNIKYMMIGEVITLSKCKELSWEQKRNLHVKRKYAFERSVAFYKKDTECFYGKKDGFEVNPSFFNMLSKDIAPKDLPNPISLHPGYYLPSNAICYLSNEDIVAIIKEIAMAYQIAFSMYYEWSIYIKEYDGIGLVIPIDPIILSELYKTSMMKFDSKKKMLHFVRDYYRRKIAKPEEDYSIYVHKYLRGEHKFDYRGFYTEIVPPKYDLLRVKTRKKFVDTF